MSTITGQNLPDPDRIFKKSFHHRNDSGELDVFEAARYFSGESAGGATTHTQKITIRDGRQSSDYWTRVGGGGGGGGGRRISLDMPSMKNHHHHHQLLFPSSHHHHHAAADHKQINLKDKKYKQPSSPGGRLASFLNSLFSQSASKKKKPKPTAATQDHDLDDSPGGRRKRRSSISHFGSTNTDHTLTNIPNINKYSVSSKNSGFRTPPAVYAHTPTKNAYRSLSEAAVSSLKTPKISEKNNKNSDTITATTVTNINKYSNSGRNVKKPVFDVVDDGAESDSSSDLFELQNYDLGDYSSGLPVYETTHMDTIKRGAPISVHGP